MALDAATPRVVYNGSGSVSAYDVEDVSGNPIYFSSNSEIHVATYVTSTGVWTDLTEGVGYTLIGGPTTGVVTLSAGNLASGTKLVIWRVTTLDQSDSFAAGGSFSATTHNTVAQKHRRIDQELDDAADRALKLDRAEVGYDADGYAISAALYLELQEASAPGTPASGYGRVYTKTDGYLYHKNDAGTETDITSQATAAAASASAASSSASAASTSASNASTSATNASTSASAASTSASAASTSASNASTSASAASTSATNAATSASSASASAGSWKWLLDTSTTMADPGSGDIRFNNASWASVTAIAVADNSADSGNPDVSAVVLTWDDSSNTAHRGTLTFRKATAPAEFVSYSITGASTDNTGWTALAVTYVAGTPTWSAADPLFAAFSRTGNVGAAGAGAGDMLAANNLSDLVSASTARSNLGLGTSDAPQFGSINLGAASDTTLTRTGAGDIAVESNAIYRAGGTDVPVTDGGTGASTAADAATNLGLGTGSSPQFTAINLGHASDTTITRVSAGVVAVEGSNVLLASGLGSVTQAYDVDTAKLDVVQSWTASQRGTVTALSSSAASIASDFAVTNNFSHTFTENTTLANPSNLTAGQSGFIVFTQHASSPKTLAFGSYWKFEGASVPSVTATNSAVDVLVYYVESSTRISAVLLANMS